MSTFTQGDNDHSVPPEAAASDRQQEDFQNVMPFGTDPEDHHRDHTPVDGIDLDAGLQFQLRGYCRNLLIDAAQPLFGMVIRLRRLDSCPNIDRLYKTVRDQIGAVAEEARLGGYDVTSQLAYRYALCSYIDEAVMSTPWGSDSTWKDCSLLSYHHNETWGGEKFFTVLERMQMDPARYQHVLEFKYLCLCLGFEGKYGQQHDSEEVLNGLIVQLHGILRELRGETPERLFDEPLNVASRRLRLDRQWPLWTPWASAGCLMVGAFAYFSISLENSTERVLRSLDFILKP